MHENAVREEEELREKIMAAVKENGSCVRFATDGVDAAEWALTFPMGVFLGTMDEEEIAGNVRLAELWCQRSESDHKIKEASDMASFGYWTGPKKAAKSCRAVFRGRLGGNDFDGPTTTATASSSLRN